MTKDKKYQLTYDIHTHTVFSHGKGTIEDNVKEGILKGLTTIGISDHGSGHVSYGVKRKDLPIMRQEVDRLSRIYTDIEILLGIEANIINKSGKLDVLDTELPFFDYILAGYHYGIFGENKVNACRIHGVNWLYEHTGLSIKAVKRFNTEMIVKALHENTIKVLTHPGDKGEFYMPEIAKACAETGTLMEISTWHKCLTVADIKEAAKTDVKFIISSDAHSPRRIGDCEGGILRALEAGLPLDRIVNLEVRE